MKLQLSVLYFVVLGYSRGNSVSPRTGYSPQGTPSSGIITNPSGSITGLSAVGQMAASPYNCAPSFNSYSVSTPGFSHMTNSSGIFTGTGSELNSVLLVDRKIVFARDVSCDETKALIEIYLPCYPNSHSKSLALTLTQFYSLKMRQDSE